jgi:hypothetical protein
MATLFRAIRRLDDSEIDVIKAAVDAFLKHRRE